MGSESAWHYALVPPSAISLHGAAKFFGIPSVHSPWQSERIAEASWGQGILHLAGKGAHNSGWSVSYQHFNDDPSQPAFLFACEPNLTFLFDLDRGSNFEELEAAPEFVQPGQAVGIATDPPTF